MSTQTETRATTSGATAAEATESTDATEAPITYREAIIAALQDELAADPTVLLMGEDVGPSGGPFKTSEGLQAQFGHARVFDTPICENGFVNVALGMAVTGLRPVVEIMFADFLPTAGDAIVNEISKFRFMSGGQCAVPMTIRTICGATGRFGTQHSATGESWYLQMPGLHICTASSPAAAYGLLRRSIRDNNPVLFFEHKGMYGRKGVVQRGDSNLPELGRAEIVRTGRDVTIVATLLMVERALKAAETLAAEGIEAEVVDLRWISPIDHATIDASLARTGRLVIAEEQYHVGGWGSAIISRLSRSGLAQKALPRAVSLPEDQLIPFSPPLEDEMIPSAEAIAAAARASVASR